MTLLRSVQYNQQFIYNGELHQFVRFAKAVKSGKTLKVKIQNRNGQKQLVDCNTEVEIIDPNQSAARIEDERQKAILVTYANSL